jgi:AcrR family transcriptional regulator
MNHFVYGGLSALEPAERPNQRALAKRRTREKILAAAKALFAERGYEGATIRDIAKAAGMSTGAVFASFTDKSDLFIDIAETEQAELYAEMRTAREGLDGRAAILAMLDAAAERQLASLALVRAIMSALWTPGLGDKVRRRLDRRTAASLILGVVQDEQGQEDGGRCATLISDMIWDSYVAALRRAAHDGLTLETLRARIHDQTKTILAGQRRG